MLAVMAMVWWPEWRHFHIDGSPPAAAARETARRLPSDDVLRSVASIDLSDLDRSALDPVVFARTLSEGTIAFPGPRPTREAARGYPGDLQVGTGSYQLLIGALAVESVLLQAYETSGDRRWMDLALERLRQFLRMETSTLHDRGFLWNDHAVAARVAVLAGLWRHVRADPVWQRAHEEELLLLAARTGRWLAKPDHFTVRTNHGVMQNVGLLQLTAAFPTLAEASAWRVLAVERLKLQLPFYVSPEGVVLEHSAAYHAMGTRLLAHAARLMPLNGLPRDPAFDQASTAAQRVLANLLRPDGSLPVTGNTVAGPSDWRGPDLPREGARRPMVQAIAGWATWWTEGDGDPGTQTHLTWAKHDGHGHKHADEGSLHLWSSGTDWITATGYWPYHAAGLEEANGWRSANAAHSPGEGRGSLRQARLAGHAEEGTAGFADMVRTRADGAVFRRQVLKFAPQSWLVVDLVQGSAQGTQTLWTLGQPLRLRAGAGDAQFASTPALDGRQLVLAVKGNTGVRLQALEGSRQPFGGWVVGRAGPEPAAALDVSVPAPDSAVATLLHLGREPPDIQWVAALEPAASAERWATAVRIGTATYRLHREADQVVVKQALGDGSEQNTVLAVQHPGPEVAAARQALREAYAQGVKRYPPWRDHFDYRVRVSLALLAWWLCSELLLGAWRRWRPAAGPGRWPDALAALSWPVLGAYLVLVYFGA